MPLIEIAGPPRERGRQYGEQAERIERSIAWYGEQFAETAGLSWEVVLATRAAAGSRWSRRSCPTRSRRCEESPRGRGSGTRRSWR